MKAEELMPDINPEALDFRVASGCATGRYALTENSSVGTNDPAVRDTGLIQAAIRQQAENRAISFTLHAHKEMAEEEISVAEIMNVLRECEVIENYPEHERGSCCLICGKSPTGRYLHVVCTTSLPELIIITVYEPRAPKWETPFTRGKRS